jgi:hypothetical protein
LEHQRRSVSPILRTPRVVAALLLVLHLLEGRSDTPRKVATAVVAVVALVVGVSSIVTVVRIGHSGAESVWGHDD